MPIGCETTALAEEQVPPSGGWLSIAPNPVRGVAEFSLEGAGPRVLSIFDSQGRLVERLAGSDGRWTWTPGALTAGVYFARLDGGGIGETVKFLYLR